MADLSLKMTRKPIQGGGGVLTNNLYIILYIILKVRAPCRGNDQNILVPYFA